MNIITKFYKLLKSINSNLSHTPLYRVLKILQDANDKYTVHIQVVNKNITFYMKPEEILADDKLVNMFSPTDVRTLTYLGYLGINAPKYKILARRMLNDPKTVFILKNSEDKEVIIKTADELLKEQQIISSTTPEDASTIGYTLAIEHMQKIDTYQQSISSSKKT